MSSNTKKNAQTTSHHHRAGGTSLARYLPAMSLQTHTRLIEHFTTHTHTHKYTYTYITMRTRLVTHAIQIHFIHAYIRRMNLLHRAYTLSLRACNFSASFAHTSPRSFIYGAVKLHNSLGRAYPNSYAPHCIPRRRRVYKRERTWAHFHGAVRGRESSHHTGKLYAVFFSVRSHECTGGQIAKRHREREREIIFFF